MNNDDIEKCNQLLARYGDVHFEVYSYSKSEAVLWMVMWPNRSHGALTECSYIHGSRDKSRLSLTRNTEATVKLAGGDFSAIGASFSISPLPKQRRFSTGDVATLLKAITGGIDNMITHGAPISNVRVAGRECARITSLFADVEVDHYQELNEIVQGLANLDSNFAPAVEIVSYMVVRLIQGPFGPPDAL